MAPPARWRAGARVGDRYTLVRELGKGGMGTVFEATLDVTGKRVALKLLRPEVAQLPGFAERFVREAQVAASVQHPVVVDVLDAGVDRADGTLYLALELLDGEELGAAVDGGRVDGDRLLRIALELLRALDASHARGLVHRDLKPENVFLTRDGRTKLLDFGVAKQLGEDDAERLTRTGLVLGTPLYMSPEQMRGEPVDGRADLWSLGAVLHDALAGRPPYSASSYPELVAAVMTREVPSLAAARPELPAALVAVVDRALARDPAKRWPTARAMGLAIRALLAPKSPTGSLRHVTMRPRPGR